MLTITYVGHSFQLTFNPEPFQVEQPFDKTKNERKNFCFITFEKEDSAKQLLKVGSTVINGVELEVKKVTPKPDPRTMGMMGMGRGGRGGFGGYDYYGGYGGYGDPYAGYGGGWGYGGGYGGGWGYGGGFDGGYGGAKMGGGGGRDPDIRLLDKVEEMQVSYIISV